MKQVKTSSGFEAAVNNEAMDDLAVIDLIDKIEEGDVRAYVDLAHIMLSDEDYERLTEHIKTEDGRKPISKLVVEVTDLMKGDETIKK